MAKYVPKDPFVWRLFNATGGFGCLLYLILWPIVLLPLAPFALLWGWWRRRRFIRRLRQQRRVLNWAEFLADVRAHPGGTVILEVGNKRPTRFWRTPDDVRSLSPLPPPALADLDLIGYGGADYHPFARWCYERYLAPDGGTASLVYPVEADFETWPHAKDYHEQMRSRFPGSDVVVIPFYDTRFAGV